MRVSIICPWPFMKEISEKDFGGAKGDPLFAVTRWSVVRRAREDSTIALNQLFTQYREPLVIYLLTRGHTHDRAEDFVQGFCAHLLGRDFLANVEQDKGRFRTFLLNAFQNYLRDQFDKENAAKRGGGRVPDSLDETGPEGKLLLSVASPSVSADRAFDKSWAQTVLRNALRRLEQECTATGHTTLFQAIEPVLFADETSSSYRQIAEQLSMTEGAVKIAAYRIRARLKSLIREEVLHTVTSEADLEEELRYLIRLFEK